MAIQEGIEELSIKFTRIDFRRTICPPIRRAPSVMKPNVPELAWIGKDEGSFALNQRKVIVFTRLEIRTLHVSFAGHSEMNEKEIVAGKLEQHLFTASF